MATGLNARQRRGPLDFEVALLQAAVLLGTALLTQAVCSRLWHLPAFDPQWTVRTGAEQLKAAFESIGLTPEDITSARFQRIEHIKSGLASGGLTADLRPSDLAPGAGGAGA